jgi:hypothetical protein
MTHTRSYNRWNILVFKGPSITSAEVKELATVHQRFILEANNTVPQVRNWESFQKKSKLLYGCLKEPMRTDESAFFPFSLCTIPRLRKPHAPLALCFMLLSCLPYFSALKIETTCSSETSFDFQGTKRYYVSEDKMLYYIIFLTRRNKLYANVLPQVAAELVKI